MGVALEVTKMFFYIMIPISCFHYYSHLDPEYFRKKREEHENDIYGFGKRKADEYVKKRAETEFLSENYNPKDIFWTYGAGLKVKEEYEEQLAKAKA